MILGPHRAKVRCARATRRSPCVTTVVHMNITSMPQFQSSRRRARNIVAIAALALPATARADVAPGPVEFSILGFFWGMAALLLACVIYVVMRIVRGDDRTNDPVDEIRPPRFWQKPLFRKVFRAACVVAFVGWLFTSCLMMLQPSPSLERERMEIPFEQVNPVSSMK